VVGVSEEQASMPGFIREAQRRAAAASAKTTEIAQAPSTRAMTTLVRAGWDFEERLGKRIWSHEGVSGGSYYSEEMATKLNDERKGS
jgi:hypothetical protein